MLNTENALENPVEISINGYNGIYFQTYYGEMCIIWEQEDYIFTFSGYGISKNELIEMARFVKK